MQLPASTWLFSTIGVSQNGWCIMKCPIEMDDFWGKKPILGSRPLYFHHNLLLKAGCSYLCWQLACQPSKTSPSEALCNMGSRTRTMIHFGWRVLMAQNHKNHLNYRITPWKLTYPLKIDGWEMTCPVKMVPFSGSTFTKCSGGYCGTEALPPIFPLYTGCLIGTPDPYNGSI